MSRVWNVFSSLFHKAKPTEPPDVWDPKKKLPMGPIIHSDTARRIIAGMNEKDPISISSVSKGCVIDGTADPNAPNVEKNVKSVPMDPLITFENYAVHSIKITHLIEPILRAHGYPETRGIHTFMPASGARFLMDDRINSVLMLRGNIYDYFQMSREDMDCGEDALGYSHYAAIFKQNMKIVLDDIDKELRQQFPRYIGYSTIVGRGKPGSHYYVALFQ